MTEMMQSVESQIQAQTGARMQDFSRIKEVVSGWSGVRQYLRGGDARPDRTRRHPEGRQALRLVVLARRRGIFARLRAVLRERGARDPGRAGRHLLFRARLAVAVAGCDRGDRAGNDGGALALREDRRHPPARPALPLASLGQGRVRRRHGDRDPLPGTGGRLSDARERAPEVDRVLLEVPHSGPARVRARDRGLQLRPRPLQRGAGRDQAAQPPGKHGEGLRPARQRRG